MNIEPKMLRKEHSNIWNGVKIFSRY